MAVPGRPVAPEPAQQQAPVRSAQPQPFAGRVESDRPDSYRVEQPELRFAQSSGQPPVPQRQPPLVAAPARPLVNPARPGESQQHLAEWMEAHRNLSLAEQHRALDNERGFRSQTPADQERLHQRLTQLNAMPPAQRQRLIDHTEAMERLTPAQRQQYRVTAAQLGSLPEDRGRAVVRAFHTAIEMPEPQRRAWMNSPQFRSQFNDRERETLNNLISIQPAAAQAGLREFAPRPLVPQPALPR
jgi:hypothetical protein